MLPALLVLTLLGDVAPPRPRPLPPVQCTTDDQCQVTTFNGCCSCCGGAVRAEPKSGPQRMDCAAVDCDMGRCAAVRCAAPQSPADFVAACRDNRCVALPRETPAAECRIDRDCTLTYSPQPGSSCAQSACGCCPYPRAVPLDARPVPLPERPQQKSAPGEKPQFGLSTGGPSGPPPPQCSPCPPPPPAGRPACLGGRCTLTPDAPQPIPRPRPRPPIG